MLVISCSINSRFQRWSAVYRFTFIFRNTCDTFAEESPIVHQTKYDLNPRDLSMTFRATRIASGTLEVGSQRNIPAIRSWWFYNTIATQRLCEKWWIEEWSFRLISENFGTLTTTVSISFSNFRPSSPTSTTALDLTKASVFLYRFEGNDRDNYRTEPFPFKIGDSSK